MPSPNPSFEPKTHRWRPGAGAPSREVPFQNCAFCAPKQPFFGQKRPQNPVTTAKRRQTGPTLHVRHDCPVIKSSFFPFSSTICPRNGPKMAKNGLTVRYLCPTRPKPRTGHILGYVAQNQFLRAPSPPATPHFLCFPSLGISQQDPCTLVLVVIYIHYYTPLPLNLANNKQQATTSNNNNNTSPCRFGHCSVPTLRIFCPCSHLGA